MWQLQQEKENQTNANYVDQIISKNLKTWPIKQNEKKKKHCWSQKSYNLSNLNL